MPGWTKHKLESRLLGEISTTPDMQMIPPLWQKFEEELKSLLVKVKEESEKAHLKLTIQKINIRASGPISSWQIDGETMETGQTLFSWAPKSLQNHCSHEIKRHLLLGRKADKPRQHIEKQNFANKGPSSQGYGFSSSHVWM